MDESVILIDSPVGQIETKVKLDPIALRRLYSLLMTASKYRKPHRELVEMIEEVQDELLYPAEKKVKHILELSGVENSNVRFIGGAIIKTRDAE